MHDIKKIKWLQLIRSAQVGPVTFWKLLHACEDIYMAIERAPHYVKEFQLYSQEKIILELNAHEEKGYRLLFAFEEDFPRSLKVLPDCPPVLSICGNHTLLNKLSLGIVGARSASFSGKTFAREIAQILSAQKIRIISGMARGIDTSAHEGSLESGTIAVLAGGLDQIYPPENKNLYEKISQQGCLVSEMPLGLFPGAKHFPRRNRLISGLSHGLLIIEAAKGSGSLITARYALEQNKDIFAVPGFPTDPRSYGGNTLIKQGAILVQSFQDILDCFLPYMERDFKKLNSLKVSAKEMSPKPPLSEEAISQNILSTLSHTPMNLESLLNELFPLSTQDVLTNLQELEFLGQVIRSANHLFSLP